ncbi:MAG TPA: DUF2017 family protein [Acidimicrobiia bacterium]|nr:DUF2017 family protein [Acidimicrobiia bacterium]
MRSVFSVRSGRIVVELSVMDRGVLAGIPDLLASVGDAAGDEMSDPAFDVLHRAAYTDDPDASLAFDRLVSGERAVARRVDGRVVEDVAAGAQELTRNEALALVRVLNEARLVLAARAGAFDEGPSWEHRIATDPALAAVAWLSHVQDMLVRAIRNLR